MAELDNRITPSGVVTFLDVLGWKGVYDRKEDAISSLTNLIQGLRDIAAKSRGRITSNIEVRSISDTIAIFTICTDKEITTAIEIHGTLCQWLIPTSILAEIPVRGATAYGEFEIKDNIFVGKAIDEAASWHEQADWIGVNLTPSAEFVFARKLTGSSWIPYAFPNKQRLNWQPHCVDWTRTSSKLLDVAAIRSKFLRLGPIVPEITGKFINTLDFLKWSKSGESDLN